MCEHIESDINRDIQFLVKENRMAATSAVTFKFCLIEYANNVV